MSWKNKVIYQIYPRSFMDSNGNGKGDLNGIQKKIDYIKHLGVDYVWISPFFKSPQKDFGYDVSDYRLVDNLFGSNDDLKRLLEKFHDANLKMVIDLVISHTSDMHPWFIESQKTKRNKYTDWYVWSGKDKNHLPNNWLSVFGGSSWKWNENRKMFFLHNFLDSQPDLNFHNPEVQEQMLKEIKFWLDFGIDGFRFDVINFIFHDKELRDNPLKDKSEVRPLGFNKDNPYGLQHHIYDNTQKEVPAYLQKIRMLLDRYGAISIGEVVSDKPFETIAAYTNDDRLHMAYCFEFLSEEFDLNTVDVIAEKFFKENPNSWPCWAFSNHDSKRITTRSGKNPKILMEKLLSLKGNICIYQGEELGLPETEVAFEDLQDPFGKAFWPDFKGRDGCRTPMPWNSKKKNYGFSKGEPWLPIDNKYKNLCVDKQEIDSESMLSFTKKMIKERNK